MLAAGLLYLTCIERSFRISRSLEIEAPLESVFAAVLDLKSWPLWSPWLLHEADAELSFSDDYRSEGGHYSWDGKLVGAGTLTHEAIMPGRSIQQQIEFLRPFKSVNEVRWDFEQRGESTLVSWEISGQVPLLFRLMAKRMEPMIGRDYELGLAMLGGYLNNEMPHPQLAFNGREDLQSFNYRAIPCNGNLRQLESARRGSIETLRASTTDSVGMSLTLYHQFDPLATDYRAEFAIPISDNAPESNYSSRSFDGGHYFKMTLRGDLKFLPLAWSALGRHCRMHGIKVDPSRPALEIYQNDPGKISNSNEVVTSLYLPIKD